LVDDAEEAVRPLQIAPLPPIFDHHIDHLMNIAHPRALGGAPKALRS
jgi:hypothetical protein